MFFSTNDLYLDVLVSLSTDLLLCKCAFESAVFAPDKSFRLSPVVSCFWSSLSDRLLVLYVLWVFMHVKPDNATKSISDSQQVKLHLNFVA